MQRLVFQAVQVQAAAQKQQNLELTRCWGYRNLANVQSILLAGMLAVIALAGLWIVFFQLTLTPANDLDNPSKYPWLTIALIVGMSSLVSPIVEEIALRGYCQQILERHFSGMIAVLLSSLLFMLAHVNYGWYWPKLSVYFLAGVGSARLASVVVVAMARSYRRVLANAVYKLLAGSAGRSCRVARHRVSNRYTGDRYIHYGRCWSLFLEGRSGPGFRTVSRLHSCEISATERES